MTIDQTIDADDFEEIERGETYAKPRRWNPYQEAGEYEDEARLDARDRAAAINTVLRGY